MSYTVNTTIHAAIELLNAEQRAAIEVVIKNFDDEAKKWDDNAQWALRWIFVCFGVCLAIFLSANFLQEWRTRTISAIDVPSLQRQMQSSSDTISIDQKLRTEKVLLLDSLKRNFKQLGDTNALKRFRMPDTTGIVAKIDSAMEAFTDAQFDGYYLNGQSNYLVRNADSAKKQRNVAIIYSLNQRKFRDSLIAFETTKAGLKEIEDLSKEIASKQHEQTNISEKINEKSNHTDTYDFINAASTRIGAILILVFMVQYLSRIHRYNKKLADYYAARANALRLHLTGLKDMNYHKMVATITPDSVDLKFVKAPTDKVFEVIKEALQFGSKKVGG